MLRKYLYQLYSNNTWIKTLFLYDIDKIENLSEQEQEELSDLVNNETINN